MIHFERENADLHIFWEEEYLLTLPYHQEIVKIKAESKKELLEKLFLFEKKKATEKALFLLSYRAYPSAILAKKLREKGFSQKVIVLVLQEMKPYLNDQESIRFLITREIKKGYGPFYIQKKLKSLGIEEDVHDFYSEEKQKEVLARLGKGKKDLLKRGFSSYIVNKFLADEL